MRRLLFATVATAALLLAAPMATAQYGPQPETTQTEPAPYTQPDMPPPTESPSAVAPNQAPADPSTASTYDSTTDTTTADSQPSSTQSADVAPAYSRNAAYGPDQSTPESMLQHAVDAGMSGVPMSAAEVCAPREVDLGASSRLNHANMNKLENAADRASVCATQHVVIVAPDGRGAAIRRTLVEHGFDDARIEVERGSDTAVQMQFAGVATSSEVYARMYNGAQYASADPNAMQGYQPSTAPSAPTPDTTTTAPAPGYEPTADGYAPADQPDPVDGQYDL